MAKLVSAAVTHFPWIGYYWDGSGFVDHYGESCTRCELKAIKLRLGFKCFTTHFSGNMSNSKRKTTD